MEKLNNNYMMHLREVLANVKEIKSDIVYITDMGKVYGLDGDYSSFTEMVDYTVPVIPENELILDSVIYVKDINKLNPPKENPNATYYIKRYHRSIFDIYIDSDMENPVLSSLSPFYKNQINDVMSSYFQLTTPNDVLYNYNKSDEYLKYYGLKATNGIFVVNLFGYNVTLFANMLKTNKADVVDIEFYDISPDKFALKFIIHKKKKSDLIIYSRYYKWI